MHRFFSHQPDLNYDNGCSGSDDRTSYASAGPRIDGFRLTRCRTYSSVEGTNCENLPETTRF